MNKNSKADVLKTLAFLLPIKANPGREQAMFDYVRDMFVALGFKQVNLPLTVSEYQLHPSIATSNLTFNRDVPNLGLTFEGDATQPHYLFNAHLDHYFSETITGQLIIKDDWLHGNGKDILAADCKAGISLIYHIVQQLLTRKNPPSIDLFFDTCEEDGIIGASEFVQHKHYHLMPFWESYKKKREVFSYSFDGEYHYEKMTAIVNKPYSIFLCKYLMNPNAEIIEVVKGEFKQKKLRKGEKSLLGAIRNIGSLNVDSLRVIKFGASFIVLNKIIPTVLIPVGIYEQHTKHERLYIPWLDIVLKSFI